MVITQVAFTMVFGALIAVAGLAFWYLRKEQAENAFRVFGQEFRISTPALVVFLAGLGLFIFPSLTHMENLEVIRFWAGHTTDGPTPVRVSGEEREPNNDIPSANLITIGETIKGVITTDQDEDFFKFKAGQGMKTRVILRKKLPNAFLATVIIYDNNERRIKDDNDRGHLEDSVSLVFDSNPNSFYYLKVVSENGTRGAYEFLVKEE